MKKYLVNFANKEFFKRQKILNKSALKFGIDKTFSYTDEMLMKTDFYRNNKNFLDEQTGAPGYAFSMWKPQIILDVMDKIKEGDVLFYIDSGAEIINDVQPLIDLCKEQGGVLLFNCNDKMRFWTKRDCFIKMGCDNKKYWDARLIMGGYQVYIKNKKSMQFLKDDLKYVQIPELIDNSSSISPNFKGFKRHGYDQSILGMLAVKHKIKGFRNPAQGGNSIKKPELRKKGEWLIYPYTYCDKGYDKNSNYPTIFYNRRSATKIRLFLGNIHSRLPLKLKLFIHEIYHNYTN